MRKANEESNEQSAALMRDLAKRRIALIRKHLKETGENKTTLSAELEKISKNLKNKNLDINELEDNIRALIYIKKNVDSSLDKNGKSYLISPLDDIEIEILQKDDEAGIESQAERMHNQLFADDKKSEDPQARKFDTLNQELKEKINNYLSDFYQDKKFFSKFKKHYLIPIFNLRFDKDKYGFSYKDLNTTFNRMVAFIDKIEDINKIENISEIQRARLVFRLLEEHPTFLDDAKKFHEYAVKLADLNKKKSDSFQRGDENGLRLTDYTIKFLQWIPKYELQLDRYKELSRIQMR